MSGQKNLFRRLLLLLAVLLVVLGGALAGMIYWGIDSGRITSRLKVIDDHKYDAEIAAAAKKHGIPVALVRAVIRQESRFDPDKVGSKGEIGLMQVLPGRYAGAAAEWARINKKTPPGAAMLYNVETNLDIGCWYLARALKRWKKYRHGTELALAEYNAGPSRANRWKPEKNDGDVISRIDIDSTRKYVTQVMMYYRQELEKKPLR